jgi:pimeloyl-ACP methyl ester carboxylesterase
MPSVKVPFLFKLPLFLMNLLRPLLEKQFQQLAFDPHTNPKLIATEMQAAKSNPMYMIQAMTVSMKDLPSININQLSIPSQIIIGESDKLVPPEAQLRFYHFLPAHQIVTIQQAAHLVMLEKAAEVNKALESFL